VLALLASQNADRSFDLSSFTTLTHRDLTAGAVVLMWLGE
jgi:hypothetical protein